jgi:hypothetical protein
MARSTAIVTIRSIRAIRAKGAAMQTLWIVIATVFVLSVLGVVLYAIIAPFGPHSDQFRDRTGRRLGESPHLETRDEFEHRTVT